ncbi:YdaS family helix-turn-helix protein [Novosphingobium sp.]|uniref:transcriptional regulator n=1 Tax=Novosphingobium sp. TaxID=1874826 RepID=UPI002630A5A6|nr:YdaS family helix-turn-helix protein [Novosphingobium sp.]
MTPFEALELAVERAGSLSALARKVPCSIATVWKWVQSSKRVSEKYVLKVEEVTGVPRHLLRPDIYPADLGPGPKWSDVRWYGVDMAAGPDVSAVSTARRKRNGNRINVLDVREQRRTA